jgi:superfamily II DNA or RNA helicase
MSDAVTRYKPGSLVRVRGRTCVVQPESRDELIVVRPLGGREEEMQAIYLPLGFDAGLERTEFPLPCADDLGNLVHGRILFDAARLSLRETCGPFRCFGKLGFRPRAYQLVPLVMALRQEGAIRLMIADDVGIGKTIEGLLVVKEMLDRAEARRFAVICPPHLCDQWAEELKSKFGIEAVVVRSSTAGALDRGVPDNRSIWQYYPWLVVSIDYVKSENRWRTFVDQAPELVVIDEAHGCARPEGAQTAQQQRHNVIAALAADRSRHMLFLTATPHSGKDAEFQSLLGFLNPEFESWDLATVGSQERKKLASAFVQRRRQNIESWRNEDTPFPKRPPTSEEAYSLSEKYRELFNGVFAFAKELTTAPGSDARGKRLRYWTALALLRGVMSSPASARMMLKHRLGEDEGEPDTADGENPVLLAEDEVGNDTPQASLLQGSRLDKAEEKKLRDLVALADAIREGDGNDDIKTLVAEGIIKKWISQGYRPIVFCRYIATADYVADRLKEQLGASVDVRSVTSEYPDEERRRLIEEMRDSPKRVLVATDCLSEGINLQELFTAVLHYDLPWNPNRLEQREGRVDRFGQTSPEVRTALIYGKDNPIDSVVLRVLLRKVKAIRDTLGISIPFPEDSRPLMDAIFNEVLAETERRRSQESLELPWDYSDLTREKEEEVSRSLDRAKAKAKLIHDIFAHEGIASKELEEDLKAADEAAGAPADVERFIIEAVPAIYGGAVSAIKAAAGSGGTEGRYPHGTWRIDPANLPDFLRMSFAKGEDRAAKRPVAFYSPVPDGLRYIGRLDRFVAGMCEDILARSLDPRPDRRVGRTAVIKTKGIDTRKVVLLVRARNLIAERKANRQIVAEELLLWGWKGIASKRQFLASAEAESLMRDAVPTANLGPESSGHYLDEALAELPDLKGDIAALALERAQILARQHERYRELAKKSGGGFEAVEPALPPDLIGLYVFIPGGLS